MYFCEVCVEKFEFIVDIEAQYGEIVGPGHSKFRADDVFWIIDAADWDDVSFV